MNRKYSLALPAETRLQNYRIIKVLGQGGFGITYLAHDEALNQEVAIKEYLPSSLATRDPTTSAIQLHGADSADIFKWGLERFLEEARILAKLSHPNIIRVFYFMPLNNTGYMIMEFEEGEVLRDWSARFPDGRPPQDEIFKFLTPLLDALRVVHDVGIAHRDIKPDNIYMRRDGSPVLLDFGAARNIIGARSHTLAAIVASGYSPNEQYGNVTEQGPWTDIYALGAVLYRLITGTTPPDAPSRIEANLSETPDPCLKLSEQNITGFDADFLSAIDWALQLRPKDRPQNIEAWVSSFGASGTKTLPQEVEPAGWDQLEEFTETATFAPPSEPPAPPMPPPTAPQTETSGKTSKNWMGVAALLLVCVGGAGGAYWWLTQTKTDLIGDTVATAFPLGAVSNLERRLSDNIGGPDRSDVFQFNVNSDSEMRFTIDGAPSDLRFKVFDKAQRPVGLFQDGGSYVSELRRGTYVLSLTSEATFEHKYELAVRAAPIDLTRRPGQKLSDALDLTRLGQATASPVRYKGRLFPEQKEHYFRLPVAKPGTITVAVRTANGLGRITLADKNGIASQSKKLKGNGLQTIRNAIGPSTYHIIVSSNHNAPFEYELTVRLQGKPKIARLPTPPSTTSKIRSKKPKIARLPTTPPTTSSIGSKKPKRTLFHVRAFARMSPGMNQEETLLAAKTLARVRLVKAAQGKSKNVPKQVAQLSNAVKLLPEFNAGVPYNENWKDRWESEDRVSVSLDAQFEPTSKKRYLTASLLSPTVKAREPIRLAISAERDMYLGIFGWQADGKVVRIYPRIAGKPLIAMTGKKLELPFKGEQPILSVPMTGKTSSDEALFVVGCYTEVDYAEVAPSPWEIAAGTANENPIGTSLFMQRLGTSCKQGFSIQVLHYVVRS